METNKYYYMLYVVDSTDHISFISNTDPIIYTINITGAKLYDDEVNVDNDILKYHERMQTMMDCGSIKGFIKAFIEISPTNNYTIIRREVVLW